MLINFKASEVLVRRIDELASVRGMNRSQAIKAAILEASMPDEGTSLVPSDGEVLELLGEAARAGNVAAMKELRTYHREQRAKDETADPFGEFDELAARRQRG